jgi:hypothetical protein
LGVKTIKKNGSADLFAGDIKTGQMITISYDGTYFQMLSPAVEDTIPSLNWKNFFYVERFRGGGTTTGTIGELGWNAVADSIGKNAVDSDNEGSYQFITNSVSGNVAFATLGQILPDKAFTLIQHHRCGDVTTRKDKVGWVTTTTDADKVDVEGIYFYHDSSVGNWYTITRSASTETATDTGVSGNVTTKKELKIIRRIVADGGVNDVRFYIDGSLVATHTTNIPTTGNGFVAFIVETTTTVPKYLQAFFVAFYMRL